MRATRKFIELEFLAGVDGATLSTFDDPAVSAPTLIPPVPTTPEHDFHNDTERFVSIITSKDATDADRKEATSAVLRLHARLIGEKARRFIACYSNPNVDVPTLEHEARVMIALNIARYDAAKGAPSTFICYLIKRAFFSTVARSQGTILSEHAYKRLIAVRKAIARISAAAGRDEPDLSDENVANEAKLHPRMVRALRRHLAPIISLDASVNEDNEDSHGIISPEDYSSDSPADVMATRDSQNADIEKLQRAMKTLKPDVADIICKRFGLNGHRARSAIEISEDLGVTRQAVSKRIRMALAGLQVSFAAIDAD